MSIRSEIEKKDNDESDGDFEVIVVLLESIEVSDVCFSFVFEEYCKLL